MCEECGNKETGYLDYMRSLLIQSIIITLRGISDFKINNYSPNIAKAVRMIETGYGQPLMLSDIARELYLSVPYLSIKFREETGVCFGEYLKRVRIQNACTLLNSTDMKIKDIAEKVGYNDYKRFGAIFREIVGTSPGKFRTGKQKLRKTRSFCHFTYSACPDDGQLQPRMHHWQCQPQVQYLHRSKRR